MRKKIAATFFAVFLVLTLVSSAFAATFKVERVRVDSSTNEIRALMKNTSTDALMFVYVPDTMQKEMLATLLSAAASGYEMYIGLTSSGGKLYFSSIEPTGMSN